MRELLGFKTFVVLHQLSLAKLSLIRPSPIGLKLMPDERHGAISHKSHVLKNSESLIFEAWPLKVDIY